MRCSESGWTKIGITCSAGRRSLWLRVNQRIGEEVESFELCAGREGDDDYVKVDRSNPQFKLLLDVMSSAAFAAAT